MTTVTLEEAQAKLPELIDNLARGDELVITRDEKAIARLQAESSSPRPPRKAGSAKGLLQVIVEDDAHLKDFAEYIG